MTQPVTTELGMSFPDEKTREDFEIALRGFIKQYQMQATAALAAQGGSAQGQGGGASSSSSGASGGAQGLSGGGSSGGSGAHRYGGAGGSGGGGQAQGLFSWGGGSVSGTPYGSGQSGGVYLNFIGGW